jgi:hypothetical protein
LQTSPFGRRSVSFSGVIDEISSSGDTLRKAALLRRSVLFTVIATLIPDAPGTCL